MDVKSVYNFVPAPQEKQIIKPEWAEQVSHDIPFSDGESGEVEIEIEAKTPIFIRNGHTKADAEIFEKYKNGQLQNPTPEEKMAIDRYLSFSHFVRGGRKEYFIPATSLKGMIRNVLEIMTLSRLQPVNDDRYSFRDLTRNSLYLSEYKRYKIHAGWLKQKNDGSWEIEECDELAFIHHEELKKKGFPFRDLFLNKNPKDKTAEYKYRLAKENNLRLKYRFKTHKENSRTIAEFDEYGKEGTLVFTGQASKRTEKIDKTGKLKASGKVHEFVFFDKENPTYLDVSERQQKDFKFIYLDHDKQNISKDWKFWREKLKNGEKVPVFYAKDENNQLKHFGLAYMYKLPYEYSVKDLLDYNYDSYDLAEVIFGSIEDKVNALKGRVFISHAFSEDAGPDTKQREILASPKASYFPFYLEQPPQVPPYKTYMDKDAQLRGFKRYYINEHTQTGKYDEKQLKNKKVFTEFIPLKPGTKFKTKIRFHNLRKIEIGALLSALTFHGTHDRSFHSLGSAKPFGYGKIQIIKLGLKNTKYQVNEYLLEFEKFMEEKTGNKWLNSGVIKELFTIAQIPTTSEYPSIEDFVEYKKNGEYLQAYSLLTKRKVFIKSFIKEKQIEDSLTDIEIPDYSIKKIEAKLKELGYHRAELPDKLKEIVIEKIKTAFIKDKATRRKLSKSYDEEYMWHTKIASWLGEQLARQLYNELKNE